MNSLFYWNMVLPEIVQDLEAQDVLFFVGSFTHLLELLTLGVELLTEDSSLRVEFLLHGFNKSDGLSFKHLFHLCSAYSLQLQLVDAGLQ